MPYEEFKQKGGRTKFGFSAVTILRSGGLSLNAPAFHEMGDPTAVVMAYDKDTGKIGIRPARSDDQAYSYAVKQTSSDTYWIPAEGFLRYHGIQAKDKTARYEAIKDDPYLSVNLKAEPIQQEQRGSEGRRKKDED